MSCCGKKRVSTSAPARAAAPVASVVARTTAPSSAPAPVSAPAADEVPFRYVGPTAATVIGPVSGRRYRFAAPNVVLGVDARDVPAVRLVPVLQQV